LERQAKEMPVIDVVNKKAFSIGLRSMAGEVQSQYGTSDLPNKLSVSHIDRLYPFDN